MPSDNGILLSSVHRQSLSVLSFVCALCLAVLMFAVPSGAQTVTDIYNFTGNSGDGFEPTVPMIVSPDGVLYGTTLFGGDFNCSPGIGCGTVFQLTPFRRPLDSLHHLRIPRR
jgi:hypothetical protein